MRPKVMLFNIFQDNVYLMLYLCRTWILNFLWISFLLNFFHEPFEIILFCLFFECLESLLFVFDISINLLQILSQFFILSFKVPDLSFRFSQFSFINVTRILLYNDWFIVLIFRLQHFQNPFFRLLDLLFDDLRIG